MKLLSATIHNYRVHREFTIEFDSSRTLIGGPNEVGKSTLIEAIHRGLFLKARGTGSLHKSMISTLHSGHPEVELSFEAGGKTYRLRKRFSGQNGSALLVEAGGRSLQGEEAEEHLAALLGCEDAAGRATAGKINEQWAHLWVWQGQSGDDPSAHAAAQQADLLQQLQQSGGTVAMQSELDGKVATRFRRLRDQIFKSGGLARAGSDLDNARKTVESAEAARASARDRLERLRQAIDEVENAEATLQRTALDQAELRKQWQVLEKKTAQVDALQQVERDRERARAKAKEILETLEKTEGSISGLRQRIGKLHDALKPRQEKLARAESALAEQRKRADQADREYQRAQGGTRNARLRRDLAAAIVSVHEKRAALENLGKRLERVQMLQRERDEPREQLLKLPEIDRKGLEKLRKIDGERAQARAALNAMAAGIEIVSSDREIRIGNRPLAEGGRRTITETTDVTIGESVCLRIHPGGGESLGQARESVYAIEKKLQAALDRHGLQSIEGFAEVVTAREALRKQIDAAEAKLDELDAEGTLASHAAAREELTAAESEMTRRLENVQGLEPPETLAAAKALRHREDESLQDVEGNESSLKAVRDRLRGEFLAQEKQVGTLGKNIATDQADLHGFQAQLKLLLDTHGEDAARREGLEAARKALAHAEEQWTQTRRKLAELQPELIQTDRERLTRSIETVERQREEARTARAVSQSVLRSDGSDDPQASLAEAEARFDAAREHHQAVARKAAAIALLDDLFLEQQRALADRFSRPLADKITGYLRCLFGSDARAVVAFEDNAFQSIDLVRSSQVGSLSFDALSGGTREQVAAAVRLAIAELLAAEHDGVLPIVFDDAFAYSDPDRVRVLQRMLDLGATRGLQVIVLTCNPSDYAGLGARQVILAADNPP